MDEKLEAKKKKKDQQRKQEMDLRAGVPKMKAVVKKNPLQGPDRQIAQNQGEVEVEVEEQEAFYDDHKEEKMGPDHFNPLGSLGKGSFGEVYLVEHVKTRK
jgi:hypothetical protein